jgi:UDP-3-O-[3-hydroxymyristoyl] glucosamine N-acyltransferase
MLYANVTIYYNCKIGKNCVLHSGSVIGADGFGFAEDKGYWVKIPQVGRVIVGDHVEIGANTAIDRGALDDTVIEDGVKLDNLIMVGHNCHIGAHTVIAGCTGIAGSVKIGRHCRIGGAAMISGHLEITDGVTISGGTTITRSVHEKDTYMSVMPFMPQHSWVKNASRIRYLEKLVERVKCLEAELTELKGKSK